MLRPTRGTKAQGREQLHPLRSSEHLARTEGSQVSWEAAHAATRPMATQGPRAGQAQRGLPCPPATGPSDMQAHKSRPPESRGTHLREWMRLNSGSS